MRDIVSIPRCAPTPVRTSHYPQRGTVNCTPILARFALRAITALLTHCSHCSVGLHGPPVGPTERTPACPSLEGREWVFILEDLQVISYLFQTPGFLGCWPSRAPHEITGIHCISARTRSSLIRNHTTCASIHNTALCLCWGHIWNLGLRIHSWCIRDVSLRIIQAIRYAPLSIPKSPDLRRIQLFGASCCPCPHTFYRGQSQSNWL